MSEFPLCSYWSLKGRAFWTPRLEGEEVRVKVERVTTEGEGGEGDAPQKEQKTYSGGQRTQGRGITYSRQKI